MICDFCMVLVWVVLGLGLLLLGFDLWLVLRLGWLLWVVLCWFLGWCCRLFRDCWLLTVACCGLGWFLVNLVGVCACGWFCLLFAFVLCLWCIMCVVCKASFCGSGCFYGYAWFVLGLGLFWWVIAVLVCDCFACVLLLGFGCRLVAGGLVFAYLDCLRVSLIVLVITLNMCGFCRFTCML